MFNVLANAFGATPTLALEVHAGQLSRWLEELWTQGPQNLPPPLPVLPFLGAPGVIGALGSPLAVTPFAFPSGINVANPAQYTGLAGPLVGPNVVWHHLVYAYLLENTGVVEIFAEVLRRAAYGETLEINDPRATQWLRTTEELFFRDPPLFSIVGATSQLRPEARIVRRNAYYRMFGMDLSHPLRTGANGTASPSEWKQHTGNGVNTMFREQWSELLRQIWLAIENRNNAVGANATDDAYLQLICESLSDMLRMRRRGGTLAREEFACTALLSWFDLTLSDNTPIVQSLSANATHPADRLALIAQQVGMTPAPRSRELFELAGLMSGVLRIMEANGFNNQPAIALFYTPPSVVYTTVNRVLDLWQSATGDRVKDKTVTMLNNNGQPVQPLRIPQAQPVTAPRVVARALPGGRS